jgi:hypothetical protein
MAGECCLRMPSRTEGSVQLKLCSDHPCIFEVGGPLGMVQINLSGFVRQDFGLKISLSELSSLIPGLFH